MRAKERHQKWMQEWGPLAAYNAEKARGIVHTPEWVAYMEQKQAEYNAQIPK